MFRHAMVTALILGWGCLPCGTAIADDTVKPPLARQYLEEGKFRDVVETTIDETVNQLAGSKPPEEQARLRDFLEQSMGWERIKDQMVVLVRKVYTRDELMAAIAFMKSPAGAAYNAKNAAFSKAYAELMGKNLKITMDRCCSGGDKPPVPAMPPVQ